MTKNYDSIRNQAIKGAFVQREVIYCVSSLVSELVQKSECFPDYEDDLYNAFSGVPDYEEAARNEGWKHDKDGFYKSDVPQFFLSVNLDERGKLNVSVHECLEPGMGSNGREIWSFVGTADEAADLDGSGELDIREPDELSVYLWHHEIMPIDGELSDDEECNFEISYEDDWNGLCDDKNIDTDDYCRDIYEHWIVSDYLAGKLEDKGERVLRDFFGMTIWCRSTTGQAILLDGVISEICSDLEILEGQKYEWEV
jgi:hypothetical protein